MRKRLTFANVTSMLALFFALSGASYAAVVLPAGSVGPRQLRANAVTAPKLARHAVQSRSIALGAVTNGTIARGAVTNGSIAPGAVTGGDIQLSTLGEVPTAKTASVATVADSAPLARVKTVTVAATAVAGTITAAAATCDPGLTVVGGGASLSSEDNQFVNDSYPSAANRWTVDVFGSDSGGGPFTVYAICVPAAATS
ncbi:MAG: hypothetical protein ACJ780_02800 [Solirubrobacteraceae bacterium]